MIRARVKEVRNRGLEPTAVVDVKEVLKSSLVNIPKETHTLYYSSSCLCPPLSIGEEYLIMGYENEERSRWGRHDAMVVLSECAPGKLTVLGSRLLLIDGSIAQKWRDKMTRKIKVRIRYSTHSQRASLCGWLNTCSELRQWIWGLFR